MLTHRFAGAAVQAIPEVSRESVCTPSFDLQNQILMHRSFNQIVVDYDASKEDKVEALKLKKAQVEERLREKRSS